MMELLHTWQIQSESVQTGASVNSLFIAYLVLCVLIKKPVFLLAFLFPEMLFNLKFFDPIDAWVLCLMEFVLYSYVFNNCMSDKTKVGCALICYTALLFAVDEYFYGINGIYETTETFIYRNSGDINLFAHIVFICSFIPYRRIRYHIRRFLNLVSYLSYHSNNFIII